ELTRIGEICARHDVLIVADEIHHDLVLPPHRHTPIARISESLAKNTITCFAPSKTFNLAGLNAAGVIIPDDGLRRKYAQVQRFGLSIHMDSYFGLTATEAAYTYGEPWLEGLLDYVKGSLAALTRLLAERL